MLPPGRFKRERWTLELNEVVEKKLSGRQIWNSRRWSVLAHSQCAGFEGQKLPQFSSAQVESEEQRQLRREASALYVDETSDLRCSDLGSWKCMLQALRFDDDLESGIHGGARRSGK